MKSLLIFLAILFAVPTFAQHQSFFHPDKRWNIDLGSWSGVYTMIYKFQDSIEVNGIMYHRLWSTQDSTLAHFKTTEALFREDSLGRIYKTYKTWITGQYDPDNEYLLYDFSLNVADTFVHRSGGIFITHTVDTITLSNNTSRKRIFLKSVYDDQSNPYLYTWIEGIGGNNWSFYDGGLIQYSDISNPLRCYFEKEELAYHNPYFDDDEDTRCYIFDKNTYQLDLAEKIKIFPNPATDWLAIEGLGHLEQAAEFSIITASGQEVFRKTLDNAAFIHLPIQLNNGLYFYTIRTDGDFVKTGKVLFQRGGM